MLKLNNDDKEYLSKLRGHRIYDILKKNQKEMYRNCAYASKEKGFEQFQGAAKVIDQLLDCIYKDDE
jgi:hypothetical protein